MGDKTLKSKGVAALGIFVALTMAGPVTMSQAPEDLPTPEQYIIGFFVLPEDRSQYGGHPVVFVDEDLGYFVVETLTPAVLSVQASLDENVRYIESNVSDHQLNYTPNDYFTNHVANWGYWKIGANLAHDKTLGTTATKDGHIDSGMNFGHEDLQGTRFIKGWDFKSGDSNPEDTSGCSFHGSHTTGTAAATINNAKGFPGLSQSNVLVTKIFGGGGCRAATTSNIANAIKFVGDNGAHVSSNSWGGGSFSTAINDAITYSVGKGVLFIASAGNSGCSNCIGNPWKTQAANVVIVTATDSNDAGASFNSKGPEVDISAPGVSIGSSTGASATSYHYMSGTSMAAPHVTGVALLIKTLNPSMTASSITSRLTSTAVDLGPAGKDDTFGYGRLNAAAAVF